MTRARSLPVAGIWGLSEALALEESSDQYVLIVWGHLTLRVVKNRGAGCSNITTVTCEEEKGGQWGWG